MALMFWDFTGEWDYTIYKSMQYDVPEPSRIKKKKANMFTKVKWFILIQIWKFNNRKWRKCRHKNKALERYKATLIKGYSL